MIPTRNHIVVPTLALIAAFSTAVVFVARVRSEPAKLVATFSPVGPEDQIKGLTAFANTQARLKDDATPIAASSGSPDTPGSPDTDDSEPVFDLARFEQPADVAIAKSAHQDQALIDHSGQFVTLNPKLIPWDDGLTLRSRQPDCKQITSKQSVVVVAAESNRIYRGQLKFALPMQGR